eukprot:UN17705
MYFVSYKTRKVKRHALFSASLTELKHYGPND